MHAPNGARRAPGLLTGPSLRLHFRPLSRSDRDFSILIRCKRSGESGNGRIPLLVVAALLLDRVGDYNSAMIV